MVSSIGSNVSSGIFQKSGNALQNTRAIGSINDCSPEDCADPAAPEKPVGAAAIAAQPVKPIAFSDPMMSVLLSEQEKTSGL